MLRPLTAAIVACVSAIALACAVTDPEQNPLPRPVPPAPPVSPEAWVGVYRGHGDILSPARQTATANAQITVYVTQPESGGLRFDLSATAGGQLSAQEVHFVARRPGVGPRLIGEASWARRSIQYHLEIDQSDTITGWVEVYESETAEQASERWELTVGRAEAPPEP
ncbi:MAG: hypothetical protein AB1505_36255 [Candidatus Latescibacterota bacterium]